MKADTILITGGLLAIIFSGLLLYSEFRTHPLNRKLKMIGYIEFKERNVQRRSQVSMLFAKLVQESNVFNGDAIRTGKESRTIIKLEDGTEINLAELSMVILRKTGKRIELKHNRGNMRIRRKGSGIPIRIESGKQTVNIKDADVRFTGKPNGVYVDRGHVLIEKNMSKREVEANIDVKKVGPKFITPKDNREDRFRPLRRAPVNTTQKRGKELPAPDIGEVEVQQ